MDANQVELRKEIEFCFGEATLQIGPEFISDSFLNEDTTIAETTLLNCYHDHGVHDWEWPCWGSGKGEFEPPRTQGPQQAPGKGTSLYTTLLERMAELMACPLAAVQPTLDQDLDRKDHSLAFLCLGDKARLLEGRDVRYFDD